MKPETMASLDQLQKAEWFANVGRRDVGRAVVLKSWDEAIAAVSDPAWENLCLEASNQYALRIAELNPQRYSAWNDVVKSLKKIVIPFVNEKTKPIAARHDLPTMFEDAVQWDILGLCVETEYSDVYPVGFYASQAFWYAKGHFPCGWQGLFPEGRLVIY